MVIDELHDRALRDLALEREVASFDVAPGVAWRVGASRVTTGIKLGGMLADYETALFFFRAAIQAFSKGRAQADVPASVEDSLYEAWEQNFCLAVARTALGGKQSLEDQKDYIRVSSLALSTLIKGELIEQGGKADDLLTIGINDLLCLANLSASWGERFITEDVIHLCRSARVHPSYERIHAALAALAVGESIDAFEHEYRTVARAEYYRDGEVFGLLFIHLFHLSLMNNQGNVQASIVRLFPEHEGRG